MKPIAEMVELIHKHTFGDNQWKSVGGGEVVAELYYTNPTTKEVIYIGELHGSNGTREEAWTQTISDKSDMWVQRVFSEMEQAGVFNVVPEVLTSRPPNTIRRRKN